ncbi:ABC transporter [Rhodoplanes elegans]|uniref:ABC transporter n=1 Tax=Rhodoplanes elegans TaxID=29408 RepID=A0A327KH63_9BRAD|nr:SbmA/BacA-like family transporter [Rhodoplanes elegans]MBK5959884.1 ABC transporter [Rhodoplanes elegans]RAI36973.1 ABC transporter [Rhodoplanes elegans]
MTQPHAADDRHRHLFGRYWRSASGFWRERSARVSWPLTLGLVCIVLSQIAVQYQLNYWNRDFFNALERRDAAALWTQVGWFVPLAILSVSLSITSVWGRMTTQRKWREWLTRHLLALWLDERRYQRLGSVDGEHQNAEYRISFDARIATDAPVDMAIGLLNAVVTALVFINVLWTVGGDFRFQVGGHTLTIHAYLVVAAVVYTLMFTTAMAFVGRNLTSVIQAENQAEAELRAATNEIRELGERVPPAPVEVADLLGVRVALTQVLRRWRQLCHQLMGTTMVSQTDILLAPVSAWIMCAPKFLSGEMSLGELTQASAAFVSVQLAFNWFVDNYHRVAEWRSSVNRVATLLHALDDADGIPDPVPTPTPDQQDHVMI